MTPHRFLIVPECSLRGYQRGLNYIRCSVFYSASISLGQRFVEYDEQINPNLCDYASYGHLTAWGRGPEQLSPRNVFLGSTDCQEQQTAQGM